jgi:spore germination protein (amino acid permease)
MMAVPKDEKVGGREFSSIFMIAVGMKLSDITTTILYESGQTAGWIMPLLSLGFVLIAYAILMSVLKRWSGKGLPEVVFTIGGKTGGTLICLLLFFGALLMTSITSRGYVDIINVMVYQRSPVYALYFMLMAAAFFVANRGFAAIARISWMILFLIEGALILLVAIMWTDIDWLRLNPIAGPGVANLLRTGFIHSAMFGEIILATLFIPKVRTFRTFRIAASVGFIVSSLKISLFMAIYTAVFDYPEIVHIAYPFQQLTKNASFGRVFTHAESFFIGFWLVISVIYFATYVYLLAYVFARAMRMDRHEKLLPSMAGLVVFIGLLPGNTEKVRGYWELLISYSTILYFALPVVIWLLDRIWRWRHAQT